MTGPAGVRAPRTTQTPGPGKRSSTISGDYTPMSHYYDQIMLAGYYDYPAIAAALARYDRARAVLEVGTGTGLVLEHLVALRPDLQISGVDLTAAMLAIAGDRLRPYPGIRLLRQDVVTLRLGREFDLAFSYGGPWYFVRGTGADPFTMISHIRGEQENRQGLERLAQHLPAGGTLLLGIQPPHVGYTKPVGKGMEYTQRITATKTGFSKQYSLSDHGRLVMQQAIAYRTYPYQEAIELLDQCGFEHRSAGGGADASLFLEMRKR